MAHQRSLTPEVAQTIIEGLRLGAYANDCAEYAGVTEQSHYAWLRRGTAYEEHLEGGGDPKPGEEMFLDYMVDCRKARAEARIAAVGAVARQIRVKEPGVFYPGWRAAIEFLRRTDPANWDQLGAHKIELTGRAGGPVQFEVGEMETRLSASLAEALPRLREIAAAGGGNSDVIDVAEVVDRPPGGWDGKSLTTDGTGPDYSYAYWLPQL